MRVLMTTDTVGGVFTYTADLASALRRAGVEVHVATFGHPLAPWQRKRLRGARARISLETTLRLEWMPDPWHDVRVAERQLLELVRSLDSDVVHLNAFAHGAADWPVPAVVVAHSCVYSWWEAVHGTAPPPAWRRYRAAVRAGLAGATAVVAPSGAMRSALERAYGSAASSARVIANGSGYAGPRSRPWKRPFVLSAGRLWDAGKNVAALERAASRAALRGRILLAGEPAESNGGGAQLLGPLTPDALARVRRSAAIYAAPARYEPFGLGILEAARDHCALVLGDVPSLRELWGDAAVYIDPGDEHGLADALEALLRDPPRTAQLGARARARSARFPLTSMADNYLSLYRELIDTGKRAAA